MPLAGRRTPGSFNRGSFKGPRGPLKGPRGSFKGPGVLLEDPGGPPGGSSRRHTEDGRFGGLLKDPGVLLKDPGVL